MSHLLPSFRARLQKRQPVLLCELPRLLVGDVPLRLQVGLVADEEDDRVGVGQVPRVRQPAAQVVVGRPTGHVIHHQSASGTAVVRPEGIYD